MLLTARGDFDKIEMREEGHLINRELGSESARHVVSQLVLSDGEIGIARGNNM
jgi:hypothetical protein